MSNLTGKEPSLGGKRRVYSASDRVPNADDRALDRRGVFAIAPEMLVEMLYLPPGTDVIGAQWDFARHRLDIYVVGHRDLPKAIERGVVERLSPVYNWRDDGTIEFLRWREE